MSTRTISVQQAEGQLLELLRLVEQGVDVVLAYGDQLKVRLVPVEPRPRGRVFGQYQGQIRTSEDFDEPLPDEFWLGSHP